MESRVVKPKSVDEGELLLALGGQIQALHDLVEKRFYDQECLLQEMAPMVAQCASRALAQPRIREPSGRHVSEKGNGDLNRLGSAAQSFVRENMAEYGARSIEVANHRAETISAPENVQQGKGTRSFVKDIVSSSWFAIAITFLISLNLILLGLEVDTTASLLDVSDTPNWFGIVNVLIVGAFIVEIGLKMVAFGCREFWFGKDGTWNAFDFLIVFVSVVDVVLDAVAQVLSFSSSVDTGQLRLIRSIRLARALRGLRVVRLFRYVTALRTLVLSIMSTMGSLVWTLALLIILFYSFGVVVTQLVVDHCRYATIDAGAESGPPQCPDLLEKYWSNVSESMLTLFMAITGGVNYDDALRPLREVSTLAIFLVILYVALAVLVVLNVVTGVFCSTAIETATADKDVATIKQIRAKAQQVEALREIFTEIDKKHSNQVSFKEVEDAISAGELASFMEVMGISTDDVWTLCVLLDVDKNGAIDLEEFVGGCMQLHGPAKSLQIAKMSFENKLTRQAIKNLREEVVVLQLLLTEENHEQF